MKVQYLFRFLCMFSRTLRFQYEDRKWGGERCIIKARSMKKRMFGVVTEVYDENKGYVLIRLAASNWVVYGYVPSHFSTNIPE